MVAGGFRTFVAGETLDEDKINDFLMQGVLVFADAAARDAAITAPVHGQVAFLKDTNTTLFYDGTSWEGLAAGIEVEYLVVGGGGGGATATLRTNENAGGGGGAGGYRCNVSGEDSGGLTSAEEILLIGAGTYPLVVGAGGAGAATSEIAGSPGFYSEFVSIVSQGGGEGTRSNLPSSSHRRVGGSAGGDAAGFGVGPSGFGLFRQGFGADARTSTVTNAGGGGGAGEVGAGPNSATSKGGDGLSSSIDGTATFRAGGGGGTRPGTGAAGGNGGGGTGSNISVAGTNGSINTGGGGGGGYVTGIGGGSGGSGVVIFRVATGTPVSFSSGVTHTTATVGDKTAYIVTATSTTSETVTIG